jgi:AcrR family transcriptional regulator
MTDQTVPETDDSTNARLSSERIATEALALIDEVGLSNFSFRSLAARLGCSAMSIYHYYPSKAHLFEAITDICLAEYSVTQTADGWRECLRRSALSIRNIALRHPGYFLHLAVFRMNSHSGMTILNDIVKVFETITSDAEKRACQFRALSYYIMGAGLDEAMGYARGPSSVAPVTNEQAARDFPAIVTVGRYFGEAHRTEIFEYGLDLMLDRFAAESDMSHPVQDAVGRS